MKRYITVHTLFYDALRFSYLLNLSLTLKSLYIVSSFWLLLILLQSNECHTPICSHLVSYMVQLVPKAHP